MGMFSFVKAAGRLLGIGGDHTQDSSKPAPPPPAAEAVKAELDRLGLPSGVQVSVEGDKVVLSGDAPDPATREKIILAAGNVAGISAVQETITTPTTAPEPKLHTVVPGDTLWAIAAKEYGNGSKYTAIFEANKPMLTDPNKIYPGQVLRLPETT